MLGHGTQHFRSKPAFLKSKNFIQFWNIAAPEFFKFLYAQFFFIMIIVKPLSSPMLNLSCLVLKLLMRRSEVWAYWYHTSVAYNW